MITFLLIILFFVPAYGQINDYENSSYLHKELLKTYTKKIKKDPKNWSNYRLRSQSYIRLNMFREALNDIAYAHKYYRYYKNKAINGWFLYLLEGDCYFGLGDYRTAIKKYDISLTHKDSQDRDTPNMGEIYKARAKAYWKLGNKQQSCRDRTKALAMLEKNQDMLNIYRRDMSFIKCN